MITIYYRPNIQNHQKINKMKSKKFKTPSRTSPKGTKRACLCPDNTYSRKCCDGSLQAQGIGNITKIPE